jgi:D-xylose transport system substrate-binding protein
MELHRIEGGRFTDTEVSIVDTRKRVASIIAVAAIVAGCSSSAATPTVAPTDTAPPAPTTAPAASATDTPAPSAAASAAGLSVSSFDAAFTAMAQLTSVTSAGSGMVGVILPDVTTSARYTSYDKPYLTQAFTAAGYTSAQFKIDNASGTSTTELALAQADITAGAKVLLVDPLDGPTGKAIQTLAAASGVTMISYDRATFQGTTTYYVSFDNVQVGKLIGQGFMDCVAAWKVASPQVFQLDGGEDTDPNAISFAAGYNSVIWGTPLTNTKTLPLTTTNSAGYKLVGDQVAPGWDNTKGQAIFQQAYTANNKINATVEANDGLANAVITVLKKAGVPANKIPTTGQDATLQGMESVLQGYQCGSVYKPIYLEAQAAVALATYLRAGQPAPAALVNGTTSDPANPATTEPAVLLTPYWVNAANMESTVIQDKFVSVTDLCAAVGAAVCTAANIK